MTASPFFQGDDLSLDVNQDTAQRALADKLDALSVVTSYSHALINTTVNPVTSPPESWYTTLSENLGTSKQHAQTWLTCIAPKVGSVIPQSIINYNNTFQTTTGEILRIASKAQLSDRDKRDIIELIESTLGALEDERSQIATVQAKILTLAHDFEDDHGRLITGQNGAVQAVELAAADQLRMQNKIAELQTKLEETRQKVTASGIGLGLAIFVAVAAFALAVATGGVGAVVVGAIGVIGVGVAATYTGIFTAEISSLIEEIAAEQTRFDNKKKQVAALNGLVGTVTSLRNKNEDAKIALTQVQTMWSNLAGKLDAVLKELKAGKVATSVVLQRASIGTAQRSWSQLADYAEKVQDLSAGTHNQGVIQHEKVRRLYAA